MFLQIANIHSAQINVGETKRLYVSTLVKYKCVYDAGRSLKITKDLYCNTELMFQETIIIKLTFLGFAFLNIDKNNPSCRSSYSIFTLPVNLNMDSVGCLTQAE